MSFSVQFVEYSGLITLLLPCFVIGTPYFTQTPGDTVEFVGENVVLNWTYVAPFKNTDFAKFSPVWNYYYPNATKSQLASESKDKGWLWEISPLCPTRLRYPVQRIFKSKPGDQYSASLTINNLTLADSGKYECRLERRFLTDVTNEMTLTVKVRPPVTTALPTTTTTPTPKPSTTPPGSLEKTYPGNFKILMPYNEELENNKSDAFKELKANISHMFSSVYQSNFISLDIKKFVKGSVIVDFEVTLYIVSEPFELLMKALEASGGTLHGLKIDPASVKEGRYTPPTEGTPDGLDTGEIIGIVFGVLAVIIVIIVIVVWLVKRKKNTKKGLRIPMTD